MKFQLIQAPNMKEAMMRIQNEMGLNAMIYRTRNKLDGIEVLAGVPSEIDEKGKNGSSFDEYKQPSTPKNGAAYSLESRLNSLDKTMSLLVEKINLLESSTLSPNLVTSIASVYHKYLRELGLGDAVISKAFKAFINKQKSVDDIAAKIHDELLKRTPVFKEEIIASKSIAAIVGPTGVGKTTTIVKLAVRFLANNSANKLGIISTDIEDLSIKNKLHHYCSLYNIDFEFVSTPDELNHAINKMANKDLILIDTHGVNQRDNLAVEHLISLIEKSRKIISVYLALPCNQQEETLNEIITSFNFKKISGCILTKVDESIAITTALGMAIMHDLSIAYFCNGQDIKKNIYMPSAKVLSEALPAVLRNDYVPVVNVRKSSKWMKPFKSLGFRQYK